MIIYDTSRDKYGYFKEDRAINEGAKALSFMAITPSSGMKKQFFFLWPSRGA